MLRSRFRYETLLRIRKRQEDLRAGAFAAARREVRRAEDERLHLSDEQRETLMHANELMRAGEFDASEVRRYYQYERHLTHLAVAKDAEIRQLEKAADKRRLELEEATKRKRVVEKLKENQNAAYGKYVQQTEQRRSDEAATNRAAIGATPLQSVGTPKGERGKR